MTAIQRRFQLNSTDQEYVQYLEEIILRIRQLVCYELLVSHDLGTYPVQVPAPAAQPVQRPVGPSRESSQRTLRFILEDPDTEPEQDSRWEAHMRKLVDSTPKAIEWYHTLSEMGVGPNMNDSIINSLIHGGPPTVQQTTSISPLPPSQNLLDRVSWYATSIVRQPRMIASFQKFILVCLCIVLEVEGYSEGPLNQLIRTNISNSQDNTLRKIRKGVLVITSVISQLISSGWGSRASLLPLICEPAQRFGQNYRVEKLTDSQGIKDPPYFARLSDDVRCERLLVEALSTSEYAEPIFEEEEGNLPISIPLVVQQILASQIDLRRISLALRMFLVDPTLSPGTVIPVHS